MNQFIGHIISLHNNRNLLKQMQQNCYELAVNEYDIEKNADHYFEKFSQYEILKRKEKRQSIVMSRLDKPQYPNKLVQIIRSIKV